MEMHEFCVVLSKKNCDCRMDHLKRIRTANDLNAAFKEKFEQMVIAKMR